MSFVSLPPGAYRIVAEGAGFKRAVVPEMTVHIGETTRADVTLELGAVTEDLALRKVTNIGERVRVELNVQSFNLLNRPYWGSAETNHSSSDFGKVTTA